MKLPSKNPITLGYGATTEPYNPQLPHNGVDFAYLPDDTIYAPFDGLVQLVPNNGKDGNGLYMHDPEGRFHGMLHTSRYLVSNGVAVKEGQSIAIMGQTGFAFGVHLHWCVKVGNQFIDPMSLITEEEDMSDQKATDSEVREIFDYMGLTFQGVDKPKRQLTTKEVTDNIGKPVMQILRELSQTAPFKNNFAKIVYYGTDVENAKNSTEAAKRLEQIKQLLG